MSNPTPSITVAADPTNPGQFLACCGLLELADRVCPGAEGWFALEGREFNIAFTGENKGTLRDLLAILVMDPPTAIERLETNGLAAAPIIAPLSFSFDGGASNGIVLDAWTQIRIDKGEAKLVANPPWNFWSGQQTSARIWSGLRLELACQLKMISDGQLSTLFEQRLFQKGRFGFDPGPAWNPLDVGFSPNEQGIEVESSPATELLAAIGLQRFRPLLNESRDSFDYFTWHNPLPPSIAAVAMSGNINNHTPRYRGSVISRGQYAALDFSFPIERGVSDE